MTIVENITAAEKAALFKRHLESIRDAILEADARNDEVEVLRNGVLVALAEFEMAKARQRVTACH